MWVYNCGTLLIGLQLTMDSVMVVEDDSHVNTHRYGHLRCFIAIDILPFTSSMMLLSAIRGCDGATGSITHSIWTPHLV